MCNVCGVHAVRKCVGWGLFLINFFLIVNIAVDKTGVPVTITIWLISPNAASMRGMRQIGLVAGTPALTTT